MMDTKNIIKTILSERGINQTILAKMLGYASQKGVNNRLEGKMSADMFAEWLDKLGYEVVVQPKTQGKRKDGAMVLEPSGLPDGRGKKQKKEGGEP